MRCRHRSCPTSRRRPSYPRSPRSCATHANLRINRTFPHEIMQLTGSPRISTPRRTASQSSQRNHIPGRDRRRSSSATSANHFSRSSLAVMPKPPLDTLSIAASPNPVRPVLTPRPVREEPPVRHDAVRYRPIVDLSIYAGGINSMPRITSIRRRPKAAPIGLHASHITIRKTGNLLLELDFGLRRDAPIAIGCSTCSSPIGRIQTD